MNIDWESESTEVCINPRMPNKEFIVSSLLRVGLKGHVWLSTSGSTTEKWVGLPKSGILLASHSVNQHLGIQSSDIWVNPLPNFHTGGLCIWTRCMLVGAKVADFKTEHTWGPVDFLKYLKMVRATITSLVPTQLFDLIEKGSQAPKTLKIVLVGGGRLNDTLYQQAKSLGWNCYPTYGCTECASQIATATTSNKSDMKPLSHVTLKTTPEGILMVKSESLLTTYATIKNNNVTLYDPKVDGWFSTEDKAKLKNNVLTVEGRMGDVVKVGGETVSLSLLQDEIEKLQLEYDLTDDIAIVASPDERLGFNIELATTRHSLRLLTLVEEYHRRVLPFERIQKVHVVDRIPRTYLNKIQRDELNKKIKECVSRPQ